MLTSHRNAYRKTSSDLTNQYNLTCGLEIHAQLLTKEKLFSRSETSFNAEPNSRVSYYDAALPGTQPILNLSALKLALKAAVALDCNIQRVSSFDRKHYFYGDQPAGYQITQFYAPFALDGRLVLYPHDGSKEHNIGNKPIFIRLKQIQLEQDTGKSTYTADEVSHIDLNRTNTPLIEIVTEPDFSNAVSASIFVKKLQSLLRAIGVCSGELEAGAMRVDVNVSVNSGTRCEIKNLFSTSAVSGAIKAEFERQCKVLDRGGVIDQETRGWDGKNTFKLRTKEGGVDYKYMPDPELEHIEVSDEVIHYIKSELPELPDSTFLKLTDPTGKYQVSHKDAKTLLATEKLVDYYYKLNEYVNAKNDSPDAARRTCNYLVHDFLGGLKKVGSEFSPSAISVEILGDIILFVSDGSITNTSGKLLLNHVLSNPNEMKSANVSTLIDDYELRKANTSEGPEADSETKDAIKELCQNIIIENTKVAETIRSGKKPKAIMFLVGMAMKASQGRVDAKVMESCMRELLSVK
ncbi:Glutamyl-tRNA amidotransferase B subunit [Nadsonia fulvescens var. elongata DSM 6958]|uniref:Glutamyl-tRNA(Gln) amidotransferase subunit B, mitochondrial n=1 Tax=Nadsonia fulvescens var. elongata DSM 6958 TaxID=857566 RepID=A0A1E3PFY8_9ASCO|nr:Glutamyl-tRNA amidotransferase B subunit [Nadsonia fulvescens var. elongata DSM 6958]